MPESKKRKNRRKPGQDAPAEAGSPLNSAEPFDFKDLEAEEETTPRWFVMTMISMFLFGLLWLVVWYVSSGALPIPPIGGWNIVIAFGVMMVGLIMAMRWK